MSIVTIDNIPFTRYCSMHRSCKSSAFQNMLIFNHITCRLCTSFGYQVPMFIFWDLFVICCKKCWTNMKKLSCECSLKVGENLRLKLILFFNIALWVKILLSAFSRSTTCWYCNTVYSQHLNVQWMFVFVTTWFIKI